MTSARAEDKLDRETRFYHAGTKTVVVLCQIRSSWHKHQAAERGQGHRTRGCDTGHWHPDFQAGSAWVRPRTHKQLGGFPWGQPSYKIQSCSMPLGYELPGNTGGPETHSLWLPPFCFGVPLDTAKVSEGCPLEHGPMDTTEELE